MRYIQQWTSELRDLDVLLLTFSGLQAQLPWGAGGRLEGWKLELERRRQSEWKKVQAHFKSASYRTARNEVEHLFNFLAETGETWQVRELKATVFRKNAHGLRSTLKAITEDSQDGVFHEIRIQAKKIRYALDAFGVLAPPRAVKILTTALKETQEGLGKFQDRSLLLIRLKTEWESFQPSAQGADPRAFGLLVGTLVGDHERQKLQALSDARRLGTKTFLGALDLIATL